MEKKSETKTEVKKNVLDGINPFFSTTGGLPVPYQTKDTEDDKYIIERAMVDVVEKTGEGKQDFIVKQELQEISRVNRADYINSHRGDVGILNILKKVQLTGDATLLNQRQVELGYADITQLPKDKMEAMDAVQEGVAAFDDLPETIKGKMSMAQFAQQGNAEFDALVDAVVKKVKDAQDSQEKKGEGE